MERALAVVDPTEATKRVVREAGTLAAGVDAGVVLLHVTTEEEYGGRREAMASIASREEEYTPDRAREGATRFAADIGDEVLSDVDVEYEAVGALGDTATEVLDAAEEYGCDHVFLAGRRRSPAGKALFGDATQRIVLDFDGYTTVTTA